MKKFCTSLREHAKKIIDLKKMLPLTKEEPLQDTKVYYSYGKSLPKIKIIEKLEIIAIMQVNIEANAHSICILQFNVLSEIPVVFHNHSNYDYHFIIR